MRLVPISVIPEGSVLGQALSDEQGNVLLQRGVKLKRTFLQQLSKRGFTSLYIEDAFTQAEVVEVFQPKVVAEVIAVAQSVTERLGQPQVSQREVGEQINRLTHLLEGLVDTILANPDSVVHLLTLSSFDQFTYKHSLNCMALAVMLGDALGLDRSALLNLAAGSVFHDMGKFFLPKEILLKPSKLTSDEMDCVRKHPRDGYDYLKKASQLLPTARIMALEHHEKWDGSGYPAGKSGNETFLHSRLFAVCDVFEALTANRPYRAGWKASEARAFVISGGGSHFDLDIIREFARCVNPYPLDSFVRLSDGREGVVRKVKRGMLDYPDVEIFVENGRATQPYVEILSKSHSVVVEAVIDEFSVRGVPLVC